MRRAERRGAVDESANVNEETNTVVLPVTP